MPESADRTQSAKLWTNEREHCTWVYEIPSQVNTADKGSDTLQFKSGEKQGREFDCVLVFNDDKQCYYLEKVGSTFNFQHNRGTRIKRQPQGSSTPSKKSPPLAKSKRIKRELKSIPDEHNDSSDDEFNLSQAVQETVGNTNGSKSTPSPLEESVQEFVDI